MTVQVTDSLELDSSAGRSCVQFATHKPAAHQTHRAERKRTGGTAGKQMRMASKDLNAEGERTRERQERESETVVRESDKRE